MVPSHMEKENCRKFAKFCFKVIKNECSNIKRAAGIRKEYDACRIDGQKNIRYNGKERGKRTWKQNAKKERRPGTMRHLKPEQSGW